MAPQPKVTFVFGPQALTFNAAAVLNLHASISKSKHSWILHSISSSSILFERLCNACPTVAVSSAAKQHLDTLAHWASSGLFENALPTVPNIMLTPMVVAGQILDYLELLDDVVAEDEDPQEAINNVSASLEATGMCSGFLTAILVTHSQDLEELKANATIVLQVAVIIGALVDLKDVSDDTAYESLSVSWTSLDMQKTIMQAVDNTKLSYVSVHYDENRATITSPSHGIMKLQEQIRNCGAVAKTIGLKGRFHHACHLHEVESAAEYLAGKAFSLQPSNAIQLHHNSRGDREEISLVRALHSILIQRCDWYTGFKGIQESRLGREGDLAIQIGSESCVPPSLARKAGLPTITTASSLKFDKELVGRLRSIFGRHGARSPVHSTKDTDIAVVGMSCRVAGADDVEGFWDLLSKGESQHVEVQPDRIDFSLYPRGMDPNRKWFGNFMNDPDAFDHKFFHKSPRESASMDPQQRWMLQVGYQAVEQSGYFQSSRPDSDRHIGCYIGIGCIDYENNVGCHLPNAYTATGNLTSFVAGKLSHYFGWTGPSMTIDTACSASAVAIHQACRSIVTGECTAALAGGITIMSNSQWFANLSGASFLSPTGACKPFDVAADGYCRGDGVGAVFLKNLSDAVREGDQILGVIPSTAVWQNENCTPITVPNAPSLSSLFGSVVAKAGLTPPQISVVEAHGTGTPVGDPAEYDSVRQVFGGPSRSDVVSLGSVKGLVGHTETASGVISLIKVLLMLQKSAIPPQASFTKMNPAIQASPMDHIEISTTLQTWKAPFRAALINNYGASGSNASLVVTQAPSLARGSQDVSPIESTTSQPFWLCATDAGRLTAAADALKQYVTDARDDVSVEDIAFSVSRQSNRTLPQAFMFTAASREQLLAKLTTPEDFRTVDPAGRPVILCFGGQVAKFVGVSRNLYETTTIYKYHIDHCDEVIRSQGLDSILPDIFSVDPVEDMVMLQLCLFANEYACSQSWITCGIRPAAIIGHSFGELASLCTSGILSLAHTIQIVATRARVIRDQWGSEKGTMLAIEGDREQVEHLLDAAASNFQGDGADPATIACYNGPKSFTVAGSTASVAKVKSTLDASSTSYPGVKAKILSVTNAFHSSLVEPLTAAIDKEAEQLSFSAPQIPTERSTEFSDAGEGLAHTYISQHLRRPVFFHHAVKRLAKKFPNAIWLEIGSNSTITNMAARALGAPPGTCHFQPLNLSADRAMSNLAEATLSLWKAGCAVQFWAHHPMQSHSYTHLLLPPYPFEKSKHWMPVTRTQAVSSSASKSTSDRSVDETKGLWSFHGFTQDDKAKALFKVHTMSAQFDELISGHTIAEAAPLCPSTLQLSMTIDALLSIRPDYADANYHPQLHDLENHAPWCKDASRSYWIEFVSASTEARLWKFRMYSQLIETKGPEMLHVTGHILFQSADDEAVHRAFSRYENLVDYDQCKSMLEFNDDRFDIIQGSSIYKTFKDIVDYGEPYRGLKKLVCYGKQSAGRVARSYNAASWLDPLLADCFCQVAGIFVNCMTGRLDTDIAVSNKIESWIRSPNLLPGKPRPQTWEVVARHRHLSETSYLSDIFIFDGDNGALLEIILGVGYSAISKAGLGRLLIRMTPDAAQCGHAQIKDPVTIRAPIQNGSPTQETESSGDHGKPLNDPGAGAQTAKIQVDILALLAELTGLDSNQITLDTMLADIGIDSLMGMELSREIESHFKCTMDISTFAEITDVRSLNSAVYSALGISDTRPASLPISHKVHGLTTPPSSSGDPAEEQQDVFPMKATPTPELLHFSAETVLEAFRETSAATDESILNNKFGGYADHCLPRQSQLCIAYVVEAFKELGCDLATAKPGADLERIKHISRHQRFVDYLYMMLEKEAMLIDISGSRITRTSTPIILESSASILDDLITNFPDHANDHKLTALTGSKLAACLSGQTDGVQLIFGSSEGRDLVAHLYGRSPINAAFLEQMMDFIQRLVGKLDLTSGVTPLKILEMGAGTGGTTVGMAALLTRLRVPVEYTFTDISPSLVAAARKRFKQYPFMRFRVHDMEKDCSPELAGTQHIVIANNCVHATRSLVDSTSQIRQVLQPNGFLMMLEMTSTLYWVDLVFGNLEGWWLHEDSALRSHVVADEGTWKKALQSAGYGCVEWTRGTRPEANLQRILIAVNSPPMRYDHDTPTEILLSETVQGGEQVADDDQDTLKERRTAVDDLVKRFSESFGSDLPTSASIAATSLKSPSSGICALVTGATGSLGSHLVARLAVMSQVSKVVCLNRPTSSATPLERQIDSFRARGLALDSESLSKITVFATDTSKPALGLPDYVYRELARSTTHMFHNAWPMSITRPVKAFSPQLATLRNLIDLCSTIAIGCRLRPNLQFISSIATVGHHPQRTGQLVIPEVPMTVASALNSGYSDAKLASEHLIERTLSTRSDLFTGMSVRIGQIAGARRTGYWNPIEHFTFMLKSAQTLKALPSLQGTLSWCPVDDVASALIELATSEAASEGGHAPLYHIENPTRQLWSDVLPVLARQLGTKEMIGYDEWVGRVRRYSGSEGDNPAIKCVDFLDKHFVRMSCGGVVLSTERARQHSETLRNCAGISDEEVTRFVASWRAMGFLR